jgi:hypothetical protein
MWPNESTTIDRASFAARSATAVKGKILCHGAALQAHSFQSRSMAEDRIVGQELHAVRREYADQRLDVAAVHNRPVNPKLPFEHVPLKDSSIPSRIDTLYPHGM